MSICIGNAINWQSPLNRGLKAWHLPKNPDLYRYDLANRNTIATISGTTWAALSPHNNAGSVNSDGSSRFLSIPAAWLTGATNASYGAWVYRSLEGNSVNIGSAAAAAAFGFIWFIDANVYSDVGPQYAYCALAGTGWHHIVIAYDGSGATNPDRLKIYIDGANQTLTFSGTPASSLGTITAMHLFRDQPTRYGTGNITDFRLFNRTLTAQQVRDWYRSSFTAVLPELNYVTSARYFFWTAAPAGSTIPVFLHHYRMQGAA